MALTPNQRKQAQVNALKDLLKNPEKQAKPDWITDKQWEANPNVYHWEQSLQVNQSKEQSKNPLTREQKVEQARINRILRGENPKDYEDFLNEQK